MRVVMALFRPPGNLPDYSSGFSPGYADRVARNVKRHAPDAETVVITDYPLDSFNDVDVVKEFIHPERGWASLMEFYRPDVIGHGTALLIGLDTVFTGPLDRIERLIPRHGFIACGGRFNTMASMSNSVVGVLPHEAARIWDRWEQRRERDLLDPAYELKGAFSEMFWMRANLRIPAFWQVEAPGLCVSWKQHLDRKKPGPDTSVVYWHGDPKPHELNDDWIKREWGAIAPARDNH